MARLSSMATRSNSPLAAKITFANIFRRDAAVSCQLSVFSRSGIFAFALFVFTAFARQSHRVLMRAFTKSAFHTSGEADRRFPKLVAQMIGSRQSLLPALLLRRLE